jgi:hypothetical protein
MTDNHFAEVRKLVEQKFADEEDEIGLTVTEFHGEKTVEIWVANRYGESAGVSFKANSAALCEFAAAIGKIITL